MSEKIFEKKCVNDNYTQLCKSYIGLDTTDTHMCDDNEYIEVDLVIEKLRTIKLRHRISIFTLSHLIEASCEKDLLNDSVVETLDISADWFAPVHPLTNILWIELNKSLEKLNLQRKKIVKLIKLSKVSDAKDLYASMIHSTKELVIVIDELICRLVDIDDQVLLIERVALAL